jgi:putative phage-type endonuclease
MTLTAEQTSIRSRGVGSSEIAAIVGISPFQSMHDVWMVKRGLATFEGNTMTRMGQRMEDAIAEEYGDMMRSEGQPHELANFRTTFRHPTEPWILASPDRLVSGKRRLAEVKNVGFRSMFAWGSGPQDIPDYYRLQVEWQLGVCDALTATGAPDEAPIEAHIVAWLGGCELRVYTIQRAPDLWEHLVNQARHFWHHHVLGNVPPPVDGSDGAKRMVHALFPESWKPLGRATYDQQRLTELLRDARDTVKRAEEEEQKLCSQIKETIGDAEGFWFKGGKVTWKTTKNGQRPFKLTWDKEDSK